MTPTRRQRAHRHRIGTDMSAPRHLCASNCAARSRRKATGPCDCWA